MKLGKLFIPNSPNNILLQEISDFINTNCVTFEKIVTKEGLILIVKSDLFREMQDAEKIIPSYEIHAIKSAIEAKEGSFFKFLEAGARRDGKTQ